MDAKPMIGTFLLRSSSYRYLKLARLGYDNLGELASATGYETNGALRGNENFGYGYDAAGNLAFRTNNTLIQAFTSDNANELVNVTRNNNLLTVAGNLTNTVSGLAVDGQTATVYSDLTFAVTNGVPLNDGLNTFTAVMTQGTLSLTNQLAQNLPVSANLSYDLNGNLLSDGQYGYVYDCANELTQVTATNQWKVEYSYDGFGRRRVRQAYEWVGGQWLESGETRYVYDGMTVLQERNLLNTPVVTYTRGTDLSGSTQGAGGIGGLLARTDANGSSYYHADGNGNVTMLVDAGGHQLAKYLYDPYGNILGMWGSLAAGNTYRYSSKEIDRNSGSYYFGYRYYQPNLQRWLNRDPLGEYGGYNLYRFDYNSPLDYIDPDGLTPRGAAWGAGIGMGIGGLLGGLLGGAGGTVVAPGVGTLAGAGEVGAAGAAWGTALGAAAGNGISDLWNAMVGGKRGWAASNPDPDKAAADKAKGRDRATGKCDRPPQDKPDAPTPPDPLRGKFPKEPPGKIMPPKDGGPAPIRGGR